jgi:hypothetical protein
MQSRGIGYAKYECLKIDVTDKGGDCCPQSAATAQRDQPEADPRAIWGDLAENSESQT